MFLFLSYITMNKLRQFFVGAATIVALAGIPKDATAQDLTMALNTPKDKTEMPALLTLDQIANKRIERAKKQVPETEREKFGKIAKEVIADIRKTGGENFPEIVEKHNCIKREDALVEVGMGFREDSEKLIEEWRKANAEWRKANAEKTEEIIRELPKNEKLIMSLKTSYEKGQSIEQIKSTYWNEILGVLDLFKTYKYPVNQETIKRLQKLGMPTKDLTVKSSEEL